MEQVAIEKLGIDVIDGDRGKNYPHQDELMTDGDCLFLSAKNVTSTGFDFSDNKFITAEKDALLRNGKLQRGDIVITTRGTVGNVALYDNSVPYDDVRINSGMLIVRCSDSISKEYVYNVLRSSWFYQKIKQIQTGSAQPQLPKSHFLKMEVPVPEPSIQNKIAGIIMQFDEKIRCNTAVNNNLEKQVSALYKSWFEDFDPTNGVCPDNWRNQMLSTIADISSGKRPPIKSEVYSQETPISIVGAASVMGFTSEANHKDKILVTGRVGTHGVIQRFNTPCWTSDNTLVITSPFYEFTNQILHRIDYSSLNRGSTQPLITQGDMKKVVVLVPDEETLAEFETLAGSLMAQWEANNNENLKLASLRDILLPKLMSGELDVSNIEL